MGGITSYKKLSNNITPIKFNFYSYKAIEMEKYVSQLVGWWVSELQKQTNGLTDQQINYVIHL